MLEEEHVLILEGSLTLVLGGRSYEMTAEPCRYLVFDILYPSAHAAPLTQDNELAAVTHHQIVLNGATLAYSATTGHLTAVSPTNGALEASFFYVAYTLDGKDPSMRPVTFFYNGGPGSAT